MNVTRWIEEKRDGGEHSRSTIEALISGLVSGDIPDYQISAWAMAVYFRGMSFRETVDLTRAMRDSGNVLRWDLDRPVVDKHSTGGIGDKISIPLAPALAACDVSVPMISGRGLGPTGGTLDKLESISGFNCALDSKEFQSIVAKVGCCITGATPDIAPADQQLYQLRDVTATVPAVPLITASILSKKLAAGIESLILDVKWGSGAFMKSLADARKLARSLVAVAAELGTPATAILTDMNQPLGEHIGNTNEIMESIDVLRGQGPTDVRELVGHLGGQLLVDCGARGSLDAGTASILQTLDNGAALELFHQMVDGQGGDIHQLTPLESPHPIPANRSGVLQSIDCAQLGQAMIELGGGRKAKGLPINRAVGIRVHRKIGDAIEPDTPLFTLYSNQGISQSLDKTLGLAFEIGDGDPDSTPLICETIRKP